MKRIRKLIAVRWVFAGLIILVILFFLLFPDWTRVKQLRLENERLNRDIVNIKSEIRDIKNNMEQMKTDPSFWERLARENMSVVKKNEILIDIKHKK